MRVIITFKANLQVNPDTCHMLQAQHVSELTCRFACFCFTSSNSYWQIYCTLQYLAEACPFCWQSWQLQAKT